MIHKIDKQVLNVATSGVLRGVITNQDVNGLIIAFMMDQSQLWQFMTSYGFQSEINNYLSVTLKSSKHPSEVLVNRINLRTLSDISDIEHGLSNFTVGFIKGTDVLALNGISNSCYAVVVPLGMLKNIANDSSLEVVLEVGTNSLLSQSNPLVNRTIGLYTYQNEEGSDFYFSYIQSNVLTQSFKDVDRLYLCAPVQISDEQTLQDLNLNILVRHGGQAVSSDWLGVAAATFGLGRIEALGPISTVKIFDRADQIVSNADITISGQTTDFSVISVSRKRDVNRISRSTIHLADKTIAELSTDKIRYKTLKRAGVVPSIHTLRAGRDAMNVPAEKKGGI